MLRKRLVAALLGLPTLFFLLWLNWYFRQKGINHDDLIILLMIAIICGAAGWEASRIVRQRYPHTAVWNGVYAALIIPFLVHSIRPVLGGVGVIGSLGLFIDSLVSTICFMLLFLGVWGDIEQRGREGIYENLWVLAAGLYLGITMTCVLLLGQSQFHEVGAAFLFVAVFALDTAAYFGGKTFGGVKLAPQISPNKTWTGALVGFVCTTIICAAFSFLPALPGEPHMGTVIPLWGFALLGAALGIAGQFGDLIESAFKRWGHVKDSGTALPGHGGFLDRFDSLFLAAPVALLLLQLFMK